MANIYFREILYLIVYLQIFYHSFLLFQEPFLPVPLIKALHGSFSGFSFQLHLYARFNGFYFALIFCCRPKFAYMQNVFKSHIPHWVKTDKKFLGWKLQWKGFRCDSLWKWHQIEIEIHAQGKRMRKKELKLLLD